MRIKTHPFWIIAIFMLVFGAILRFWQITANQFLFYDEGMYLGYNRMFLNLVSSHFPQDIHELFVILSVMIKAALGTAKALWFFLLNLRVFILGPEAWYFARLISAFSAMATIGLTYLFVERYLKSKNIALLSVIFLSVLPSHVFYSRLGMQESLSALLFLSAIYLYLFCRFEKRGAVISAVLLVCLYLTNYRMIIAPVFILSIELYESFKEGRSVNWSKALICASTFAVLVFVIGSLYGGINRYVTFGWMSHQAQDAQTQRSLINIFSYPSYLFVLDGFLFGFLFWSNIYLCLKRQWVKLLPFALVIIQMGGFTLAAEKGARYLCVVLPFVAIAAAVAADYFLEKFPKKKILLIGLLGLTCLMMTIQSILIMNAKSDYEGAVHLIMEHDSNAGILSTQPLVEQLYVKDENRIKECPKNLADFIELYKQGYHYLIIDPQVYISWTKDTQRFSPPLIDFLESITSHVKPIAVFTHLNSVLLTRFVWDHNQNFVQSLKFLYSSKENKYGQIKIYDIGQCLLYLRQQAMEASLGR